MAFALPVAEPAGGASPDAGHEESFEYSTASPAAAAPTSSAGLSSFLERHPEFRATAVVLVTTAGEDHYAPDEASVPKRRRLDRLGGAKRVTQAGPYSPEPNAPVSAASSFELSDETAAASTSGGEGAVLSRLPIGTYRRARTHHTAPGCASQVLAWLAEFGLEACSAEFERQKIDCESITVLEDEHLIQLGVMALGDRIKLRSRANALHKQLLQQNQKEQQPQPQGEEDAVSQSSVPSCARAPASAPSHRTAHTSKAPDLDVGANVAAPRNHAAGRSRQVNTSGIAGCACVSMVAVVRGCHCQRAYTGCCVFVNFRHGWVFILLTPPNTQPQLQG